MRAPTRRLTLPAGLLVGALAAGCAAPGGDPHSAWRVEPLMRLSHGGSDPVSGLMALGRAYEGERRWRDAADAYRRAAVQAPDDPAIQDALGRTLAAQHRHAEAVAALRRAVELQPASAQRLNNLGYALLLHGQHEEASRVLRQALELDPGHARARANLAALEREHGTRLASAPQADTASKPVARQPGESIPALQLHTAPNLPPLQMRSGESSVRAQARGAAAVTPPASPVLAGAAIATSPALPAAPGTEKAQARLEISNGNGITGAAARLAGWLRQQGYLPDRLSNLRPFATPRTVIQYREGFEVQAQALARELPVTPVIARVPTLRPGTDVRVILGHDAAAPDRGRLARSPGGEPGGPL